MIILSAPVPVPFLRNFEFEHFETLDFDLGLTNEQASVMF